MKKNIILLVITSCLLIISCKQAATDNVIKDKESDRNDVLQIYHRADSLYFQGNIDRNLFNQFIEKAIAFSENYPEEVSNPDLLSKAGVAAMILAKSATGKEERNREAKQGLELFNKIQKVYPDYEGVKKCYINRAIIYDDILEDYPSAETEYRDFIHKYPTDSLADNIRVYLEYLGKDTQTMVEKYEKNDSKVKP